MNDRTDRREMAGTALCALLSLVAFVPLVVAAGRLSAVLVIVVSLACPVAWFLFLSWSGRDGGGPERPARTVASGLRVQPVPVSVSDAPAPEHWMPG